MKRTLGLLFSFLLLQQLYSQSESSFCCTDAFWNYTLSSNPLIKSLEAQFEYLYYSQGSNSFISRGGNIVRLPVVVHIVHNNGSENISDSKVFEMIDDLNDAFRNRNAFHTNQGVDFEIEFCLALRDTQGVATTGIIRHISPFTDMSLPAAASQINSIATWNPEQYINIRLVREVCTSVSCIGAGYASMPAAHGASFDGLIFEAKYAGGSNNDASVIIHEMGHYLGLDHTFRGGCNNNDCLADGDRVCDTPPDNMNGSFPCDVQYNSCQTDENDTSILNPFRSVTLGGLGDQPDMIQNYMDYSAYACYDRFTLGQQLRVLFFLQSARFTLLTSKSCLPPCPDQPVAFFSANIDTINAGEIVIIENNSQFASMYTWCINGVPSGHATDTNFQFVIPGTYIVKLIAESGLVECSSSAFEREIEVVCPVQSNFSYSLDDSQLYVYDQSFFADSLAWRIEDGSGSLLFSSQQLADTFDLTGINYIRICLSAFNDYCFDKQCEYFSLLPDGIEICNNQIDDDGDQLVDLFDPDCPCTDSTYQALCELPCQLLPDIFPDLSMQIKWQSEIYGNHKYDIPNIIVGNADKKDSNIEILTRESVGEFALNNVQNSILIIDGVSGLTKMESLPNPNSLFNDYSFLAMGDSDRNGLVEIYSKDWDSLFCFNTNGTLRWVSDKLNTEVGSIVNLADFNGDGISEVYSGNNIFNADNGKLLMNNLSSSGCNIFNGAVFSTCNYNHSIAADLLPSPGLELAAGNVVYEIQINNVNSTTGNNMIPIIADIPVLDGITSVGDIDGDGQLDVIVVRDNSMPDGGGIWIWNPRTRAIIASAPSGADGSIPFIGDVDGDCAPEIGMTFDEELRMYKYNGTSSLQLLYNLPTSDKSGKTGITMFDFNQDGKNELVYRDETDLRIISGATGSVLATYPVKSGTGLEYPVIADVDQDGEADIVVNGYLNDPAEQRIFCFEGIGSRWAPARAVWNQPGYNVTNINDDLTIPRYPQNPAKSLAGYENCLLDTCATPYNTFNVQATYRTQAGCVQFPGYDLSFSLISYTCQPDKVDICFVVENMASLAIRDELIPFSAYPLNPFLFSSSPVVSFELLLNLDAHALDTICYAFPMMDNLDSIFIIANDSGTVVTPFQHPVSQLIECRYENNIDLIHLNLANRILDLGPDITKCESEVITLNAGSGFTSYLWSDFSTDSIYSSSLTGPHFVVAKDQCSREYTDTVLFEINTLTEINLGQDTIICSGDSISFSIMDGYDFINWIPSNNVGCDTCAKVTITADTSFQLIVVAGTGTCLLQDSLNIIVKQPFNIDTTIKTCIGDTVLFNNVSLPTAGLYSIEIGSCDTIYNITVSNYSQDSTFLNIQQCSGDSVWFNGAWLHSSGSYSSLMMSINGCDSIVSLDLTFLDTYSERDTLFACLGDSVFVFNQWIHSDTSLKDTLHSINGCDSVITINVIFNPFLIQSDLISICDGDSVLVQGVWVREAGSYLDTIVNSPCNTVLTTVVNVNPISFHNEHFILCPGDSIWLANNWVSKTTNIQDTLQNELGCDSVNLLSVEVIPAPESPSLSLDCDHGIAELYIHPSPLWHILWSNGDTTNQTTYFNSDSAVLFLSADPACLQEFVISIPKIPLLTDLPIFNDTFTNPDHSFQIQLPLNANEWSVEWLPSDLFSCPTCLTTTLSVDKNTEITVALLHEGGCEYLDSFYVYTGGKAPGLYIPNVFSPNGDSQNEIWHIFYDATKGNIESLELFDRWGNMVHRGSQIDDLDWNGTFRGQLLSQGVYTYKLLFQPKEGAMVTMWGNVTLIR